MLKHLLIAIFPAILTAGNIGAIFQNHSVLSSYTVESPTQFLKAQLDFPSTFNTLGLFYTLNTSFCDITFQGDFLVNSETTKGKDYDWFHENLTVYSTSDNKVNSYNKYTIEASKEVQNGLSLVAIFSYTDVDMAWYNTVEYDYVSDTIATNDSLSLSYQQKFYKANLGMNYETSFFNYFDIQIEPSLTYAYIEAKDTHILRNFYTMQYSNAFGYRLKTNLSKQIGLHSKIVLEYSYEMHQDQNTNMHYYNNQNEVYLTLPSSHSYENSVIGVKYSYMF